MITSSHRIALVTGGGKRLGRWIALALARAGWDVVVHCNRSREAAEATAQDIRALDRQAWVLSADLESETEVAGLIPACVTLAGLPGCLVNNASLFEYDDPASFDPALLRKHMVVNLQAPLLLARHLHQAHRQAREDLATHSGVIINLLDQKLINLNPDYLSYTLSKAALETATRLLAQAMAPHLRVVGLAPGITLPSGPQSDSEFARAHQHTPLGHSSYPEDIAEAAVYLASARGVTGTTLYVDGGQHLHGSNRDVMFTDV